MFLTARVSDVRNILLFVMLFRCQRASKALPPIFMDRMTHHVVAAMVCIAQGLLKRLQSKRVCSSLGYIILHTLHKASVDGEILNYKRCLLYKTDWESWDASFKKKYKNNNPFSVDQTLQRVSQTKGTQRYFEIIMETPKARHFVCSK